MNNPKWQATSCVNSPNPVDFIPEYKVTGSLARGQSFVSPIPSTGGGCRRARGAGQGARAARVALSPESRAARNACIIIMTDADRAAAPLICGAFDLAGAAAPAAQTSRLLTFIRSDAALPVVRPFALNRGFW